MVLDAGEYVSEAFWAAFGVVEEGGGRELGASGDGGMELTMSSPWRKLSRRKDSRLDGREVKSIGATDANASLSSAIVGLRWSTNGRCWDHTTNDPISLNLTGSAPRFHMP